MDHRECGAETALADERRGEVAARDVAPLGEAADGALRAGRIDPRHHARADRRVPAPERHADMRPLRPLLPALAQLFGPPETD